MFDYSESIVGVGNTVVLESAIGEMARRFDMEWKISYKSSVKRMAILVSKQDHCLYDLLIRFKSGELTNCELPVIISNHPDLEPVAKMFGVEFRCLPIAEKGEELLLGPWRVRLGVEMRLAPLPSTPNPRALSAGQKQQQEAEIDRILGEYKIDFLVLARYMQVCSRGVGGRIGLCQQAPLFSCLPPANLALSAGLSFHFICNSPIMFPVLCRSSRPSSATVTGGTWCVGRKGGVS